MSLIQGTVNVAQSNKYRSDPALVVLYLLSPSFWAHLALFQRAEIVLPPLEKSVGDKVLEIITATLSALGWEVEKGSQPNKLCVSVKRNGNGSATQGA